MFLYLAVEYVGCYLDNPGIKNLDVFVGAGLTRLTPYWCTKKCWNLGEAYSGVSGGDICHCGNTQPRDQWKMDERACSRPCTGGDGSLTCGGHNYLVQQVYRISQRVPGLYNVQVERPHEPFFSISENQRALFIICSGPTEAIWAGTKIARVGLDSPTKLLEELVVISPTSMMSFPPHISRKFSIPPTSFFKQYHIESEWTYIFYVYKTKCWKLKCWKMTTDV